MRLSQVISSLMLVLTISISVYNAVMVLDYAWNYKMISEELCINKDTEVTTCNGMCYLADAVVAPKPVPQDFTLSDVNFNLSFLFYFVQITDDTNFDVKSQLEEIILILLNPTPYITEVPVPPPSLV